MLKSLLELITIYILLILTVSFSYAELYKFVDEEGTLHFTNVPTDKRFVSLQITKPILIQKENTERKRKYSNNNYSYKPTTNPLLLKGIHQDIDTISKRYNVEPSLVRAVIKAESEYDPSAVSPVGAMGLMQLMPKTADYLGVYNPFDPKENLVGGIKYLRYLLDVFKEDVVLALAAYNAGEDTVRKYNNVPPYDETRNYVKKVLKYYWSSIK